VNLFVWHAFVSRLVHSSKKKACMWFGVMVNYNTIDAAAHCGLIERPGQKGEFEEPIMRMPGLAVSIFMFGICAGVCRQTSTDRIRPGELEPI
jgi:hypothetical protein